MLAERHHCRSTAGRLGLSSLCTGSNALSLTAVKEVELSVLVSSLRVFDFLNSI